jgi:hypothetical protein
MLLQFVGIPVFVRSIRQNPAQPTITLRRITRALSSGGSGGSSSGGGGGEPPHDEWDLARGKLLTRNFKRVGLVAWKMLQ